jgi:hypothetical protein
MSSHGFVYILTNNYMPGVYKIGCTERSPHARAAELSGSTGVPAPFDVLCYVEVRDFQGVERRMHHWLRELRISPSREFFEGSIELAIRLLWWLPGRLSFVEPGEAGSEDMFCNEAVDFGPGVDHLMQTENPFEKKPEDDDPAEKAAHNSMAEALEG